MALSNNIGIRILKKKKSPSQEEPVRTRFLAKLLGNILSAIFSFGQQAILARMLGPSGFGALVFIQGHLVDMMSGLELGTSTTFFTAISQHRRRYIQLAPVFATVIFLTSVSLIIYVFSVANFGLAKKIWPGIPIADMIAGIPLGIGFYLSLRAIQIADAAGISKKIELLKLFRSAVVLFLFVLLGSLNLLSTQIALITLGLSYLSQALFIFSEGHSSLGSPKFILKRKELLNDSRELWRQTKPLAIYTVFGLFIALLERWILQFAAGVEQQGFYGIGSQLGAAAFLIASSMTPIFHRESAIAFATNDKERLIRLFSRQLRYVFFFTATISIFMAMNSLPLVRIVAGEQFVDAASTVSFLCLLPIHQTYGQLSSSLMLATNRTRTYGKIGIISILVGLGMTYAFVGDPNWEVPGLGLGALGLSIKFFLQQLLSTSVINYSNCKYLNMNFSREVALDVGIIVVLGSIAWFGRNISVATVPQISSIYQAIERLVVSGTVYASITAGLYCLAKFKIRKTN